ncbi:MAG: dienelactone hydrolase family protein [Anaerolineales bacterium]|nr:dienelactone hydrolase family protein [Anaerolineales bacterium]
MATSNKIETLQLNDWVLKYRQPPGGKARNVFLLVHGWTGNEDLMWVFASRLPEDALLIAPRAPYPSELGGFSWVERKSGELPWLDDFRFPVELVQMLLNDLSGRFVGDFSQIDLVGFSQGGALALAFAMLNPARVKRVAGLATFLPEKSDDLIARKPLVGKPVFLGHGTEDEIVPVELARNAVRQLQAAGADVSYCETETGHKLGADCFNAYAAFFERE